MRRTYSKGCNTEIMANSRQCEDTCNFLGRMTLSSVRTDTTSTELSYSSPMSIQDGATVLTITLLQFYLTNRKFAPVPLAARSKA